MYRVLFDRDVKFCLWNRFAMGHSGISVVNFRSEIEAAITHCQKPVWSLSSSNEWEGVKSKKDGSYQATVIKTQKL